MTFTVELPFPPKDLNPNRKRHWGFKHRATKSYRETCHLEALAAGARHAVTWEGPIQVVIEFYPPDLRCRDDDNMEAAFKAGRDGLADALGVNDARFRVHRRVMDVPGNKVIVRISPVPE